MDVPGDCYCKAGFECANCIDWQWRTIADVAMREGETIRVVTPGGVSTHRITKVTPDGEGGFTAACEPA